MGVGDYSESIYDLPNTTYEKEYAMTETNPIELVEDLDIRDYVRRPFYIKGVMVTEANMAAVTKWCGGTVSHQGEGSSARPYILVNVPGAQNERQTTAFVEDWVLFAGRGFKVYTQKAFTASFEPKGSAGVSPDPTAQRAVNAVREAELVQKSREDAEAKRGTTDAYRVTDLRTGASEQIPGSEGVQYYGNKHSITEGP